MQSARTSCGPKSNGFSPSCADPELSQSRDVVLARRRGREHFAHATFGVLEKRRAVMAHVERHERIVELFAQPIRDARLLISVVAKVDDVAPNESEKPGVQRVALGVGNSPEL